MTFDEFYHEYEVRWCMSAPMEQFARLPGAQVMHAGNQDLMHIYFERGSSILAVAHLDSVATYNGHAYDKAAGVFHCATVDDRIGVWTILYVLPRLGVKVDVLLTTNEERGTSTAGHFVPAEGKTWNWMVEFDRGLMGTSPDWVAYSFKHQPEWAKALDKIMTLGHGSNSDINHLKDLGICGVNVQTGMKNYHAPDAHVDIAAWQKGIDAFLALHKEYADTRFEYDPKKHKAPVVQYSYNVHGTPCEICGGKDSWPYPSPYVKSRYGTKPRYNLCRDCVCDVLDAIVGTFGQDAINTMVTNHLINQEYKELVDFELFDEGEGDGGEDYEENWAWQGDWYGSDIPRGYRDAGNNGRRRKRTLS